MSISPVGLRSVDGRLHAGRMHALPADGRTSPANRSASAPWCAWDWLVLLSLVVAVTLCFPAPSSATDSHSVCQGQDHRCLLNTTGQLYCWGADNAPPWNALPVPDHLAGVEYSSVRCGRFFTCAIRAHNKTVDCFGSDQPDPSTGPVATSVAIAGIRVSELALGDYHGLIITEDGMRVISWGHNDKGQLQVPSLGDDQLALNMSFRSIGAGATFSCVMFRFPNMDDVPPPRFDAYQSQWFWPWCAGQLQWLSLDPLPPQGITLGLPFAIYRDLSCSGQLCCLINMDGVMACMGVNEYAQLNFSLSSIPYAVSVSSGVLHSVAMRLDGTLVAWGLNNAGQSSAPAGMFSSANAGWAVSCVVRADTSVQCFDSGGSPPPLSVARCSTGEAHTCCIELMNDEGRPAPCTFASCPAQPGPVFCFGADYSGQSSPPTDDPILNAVDIAAGWSMTCVLKSDWYIRCWGAMNWDAAEQARVYSTQYSQITLVGGTLCMLRLDNQQIECSYGADAAPIPTQPDGTPFQWRSVVTLDFHQCGLLLNSSVLCWGNGGWNIQEHTPPLTQTFNQIMGGCLHVCAISTEMQVTCWGDTSMAAAPAPTMPAGYLPVRLEPGYYTSSVLLRLANDTSSNPTLVQLSWGKGAHGTAHPSLQPYPSMRPVHSISFGDGFGCMILPADNTPLCWGTNYYSQTQSFTMRARVAPRYSFESGTGILPCPPGTFSLGPGAMSPMCSGPCAAGRYGAPDQLQSDDQCSAACPPGFSCMAGSSSPQPCDPYTYSSSPGAAVCDVCSGGLWVFANRTRCGMPDCPRGSEPADNECVQCSVGTYSPGGGQPCQVCAQGFSAPYDGLDHCLDCSGGASEGLSCSNTGLTIMPGFFLLASPEADMLMTQRCPPQRCTGDASHSVSVMPCSANRNMSASNLFCAACEEGFDEWNARCVECPSSPRWGLLFLLLLVSFAAVFVFHLLSQSSAGTASLGTASYFIQVVSQLQLGPQELSFSGALAFLSSFNLLQAGGGLCLAKLSPYEFAVVRMMSAPIAFAELGLIAAIHCGLWTMGHCRTPSARSDQQEIAPLERLNQDDIDADDSLSDSVQGPASAASPSSSGSVAPFPLRRYLRSACALLLFLYQDVAFTSLSLLTCVGIGGSRLVYYSPGLDCSDPRYGGVRAMAVLLVILGVVGVPALVVTVLARKWLRRRQTQSVAAAERGSPANGRNEDGKIAGAAAVNNQQGMLAESLLSVASPSPSQSRGLLRSPFAPFDESFHPGAFFWTVCVLLRRLLLIILELLLLQQSAGLRYLSFAYFHLVSLLLHARFRPYLRSLDNDLESFALVMLTALSGSLMLVNEQESNAVAIEALHTIMILAPVAVFVVIIAGHKLPKLAAHARRLVDGLVSASGFRGRGGASVLSADQPLEEWSSAPHQHSQARV